METMEKMEERLGDINSALNRETHSRRGRFPTYLLKSLEILAPCKGYENGISIKNFAKKLYSDSSTDAQIKGRQEIASIRRKFGLYIYSVKPMGMKGAERRYCHLNDPDEFQQVINGYEGRELGNRKGKKEVTEAKENIKETRLLARKLEKVMVSA